MKLFLSRTIDGLEKSFVPNEELSTKLVYMMDQSEHSEDDFETENDSTEEISRQNHQQKLSVASLKRSSKVSCRMLVFF